MRSVTLESRFRSGRREFVRLDIVESTEQGDGARAFRPAIVIRDQTDAPHLHIRFFLDFAHRRQLKST
jgi:hypothetical protein